MPAVVPPVLTGLPAEQPRLVAGDLRLRPWEAGDAPALLAAYADPLVQHWNLDTMDEAEARAYADVWAAHWTTGQRVGWAVVRGDVLVGRVTIRAIDLEQGCGEVTYWVVPAARGTGVAPASVEAVVSWAFGLGFHRLTLQHSTQNTASCRVAEKSGFALEGTMRSSVLHDDGWHDMHLHARVAEDLAG